MEIYQTLIIILLIIICILLITFLIADIEFPPPSFVTPFSDGSVIRIKSLANGKYLRIAPRGSSGPYANCTDPQWVADRNQIQQIVVDTDDPFDHNILWTLCQYSGSTGSPPTPGNNAVYVLFSGNVNSEQVMACVFTQDPAPLPLLVTTNEIRGCPAYNQLYPNIPNFNFIPYFSFQLQENGTGDTNGLQSNAFIIRDGINGSLVMTTSGNPSLSTYQGCVDPNPNPNPTNCIAANNCPSLVFMQEASGIIGAASPLDYTYQIEVVSSPKGGFL